MNWVNWIASFTLAFASFSARDKSIEKKQLEKKNSPKCSYNSDFFFSDISNSGRLLVFVSFSLPLATWTETSHYLEPLKGAFIVRGLPNNSFEELQKKILDLRKAGVRAEILLDPAAFETYNITAIPALVITQENHYDKVFGNIRIPDALSLFSESGDTQETALKFLKMTRPN